MQMLERLDLSIAPRCGMETSTGSNGPLSLSATPANSPTRPTSDLPTQDPTRGSHPQTLDPSDHEISHLQVNQLNVAAVVRGLCERWDHPTQKWIEGIVAATEISYMGTEDDQQPPGSNPQGPGRTRMSHPR